MKPPRRGATHPPYELFMDELLRIHLPGTSVNRGNKKGRSSTPAHVPLSRLTSLRLGEALRLAREVHSDIGLLSHDPGVVPRANYVHVPRPYLLLGAVVVDEVHPTRNHVPRVQYLAAIGPHDGLGVLRPTPPGFGGESRRGDLVDVY